MTKSAATAKSGEGMSKAAIKAAPEMSKAAMSKGMEGKAKSSPKSGGWGSDDSWGSGANKAADENWDSWGDERQAKRPRHDEWDSTSSNKWDNKQGDSTGGMSKASGTPGMSKSAAKAMSDPGSAAVAKS